MNDIQQEILDTYANEVTELIQTITVGAEGEHIWDNYERVTAVALRLGEMHNEISEMEIFGRDWPEIKKFRTLVIDPTIERLDKVAAFESRKITGKQLERDLEK